MILYDVLIFDSLNFLYRVRSDKNVDCSNLVKISNKVVMVDLIRAYLDTVFYLEQKYLASDGRVFLLFDNATSRDELKKMFAPLAPTKSRKEVDNAYKENRMTESREFYNTLDLIKYYYMVSSSKYRTARIQGLEADDLVKPCIDSIPNSKNLMITNDSDWARYLDSNTHYLPHTFEPPVTDVMFQAKRGFYPTEEKIILDKILFGDSADNVKEVLPELPKALREQIRSDFDCIQNFILNYELYTPLKEYVTLVRDRLPELRIAYQMVATIPVSDKHFFYSCSIGRDSKVQRTAIESVLKINNVNVTFEFGDIKVPRVNPVG